VPLLPVIAGVVIAISRVVVLCGIRLRVAVARVLPGPGLRVLVLVLIVLLSMLLLCSLLLLVVVLVRIVALRGRRELPRTSPRLSQVSDTTRA
jgi:hypothetical protein